MKSRWPCFFLLRLVLAVVLVVVVAAGLLFEASAASAGAGNPDAGNPDARTTVPEGGAPEVEHSSASLDETVEDLRGQVRDLQQRVATLEGKPWEKPHPHPWWRIALDVTGPFAFTLAILGLIALKNLRLEIVERSARAAHAPEALHQATRLPADPKPKPDLPPAPPHDVPEKPATIPGRSPAKPTEPPNKKPFPGPPPSSPAPRRHPSSPDGLANLPYAALLRQLEVLTEESSRIAGEFARPEHRRLADDLSRRLPARAEGLLGAARRGPQEVREHWVDQQLIPTLDSLARLLSFAIAERRESGGGRALEQGLCHWLYERLAKVCREEGWFYIEPILPYETPFDPEIHRSVASRRLEGVPPSDSGIIIEIQTIGCRDLRNRFITRKAQVVLGV